MTSIEWLIDDNDRYARTRLIAWWDQAKIQSAKILVVGAGALGNEVIKNLALLGIGSIYIVDFDLIEASNLNRSVLFRDSDRGKAKATVAAEMASRINPDVKRFGIRANVISDVGLGLFHEVDLVIGCLDNREARLWVNRQCWRTSTPWVDGGIQEINGVVKVFQPPQSACYECAMTELDYQLVNLRYSCPLLKREDIAQGKVPTSPTIASIIAGMQTQEALKLLHGLPTLAGHTLVYNGVANKMYTTHLTVKPDCLSHETWPQPQPLPLAVGNTPRELFTSVRQTIKDLDESRLTLDLDREWIRSRHCRDCELDDLVGRTRFSLDSSAALCARCEKPASLQMIHQISEGDEFADRSLAELGVPEFDIVRVHNAEQEFFFLLEGDRPKWAI